MYCVLNLIILVLFIIDVFSLFTFQLGKKQEFDIGVALRNRYGSWLGDIYYPDLLEARSTSPARTRMSLLLTLAGLFPPAPSQQWNSNLNWQPIPYTYKESDDMVCELQ